MPIEKPQKLAVKNEEIHIIDQEKKAEEEDDGPTEKTIYKRVELPMDPRAEIREVNYNRSSWVLYSYFILKVIEQMNFLFFISF